MLDLQVQADGLAAKVGELRLAGLSFRQIAESVGCSTSSASEGWKRFRKALVRGSVEEERNTLLARCEKLLRHLAVKVASGDVLAVRAATEILRLMSDVGGYAMPAQVEVKAGQPVTRIEFVVEPVAEKPDPWLEGQGRDARVPLLGPAEAVESVEVAR